MMNKEEIERILSLPYSRILTPDPSGGFTAEILEFPGCVAEGETVDVAYMALNESAKEWIVAAEASGFKIPDPRSSAPPTMKCWIVMAEAPRRRGAEVWAVHVFADRMSAVNLSCSLNDMDEGLVTYWVAEVECSGLQAAVDSKRQEEKA